MFKSHFLKIPLFKNQKTTSATSIFSIFTQKFNISHYTTPFKSTSPSNPNRSQLGLWHMRRQQKGKKKCFSMKHSMRTFKVNTFIVKLYSKKLKKFFWINVSTKALKTIRLYGGLDNYILKANQKYINDSLFATFLKRLLLHKGFHSQSNQTKDLNFKILKLPYTSKPKMIRITRKDVFKRLASIYIPAHLKREDLSTYLLDPTTLLTRVEKQEIENIYKELDITTENEKRLQLRERLKVLQKDNHPDILHQFKSIMVNRHLDIRNEFMRIKDKYKAKIKYMELLKESENVAKQFMGKDYKHYSEDYPEIQLLLQQTEQQRKEKESKKSAKINKNIRELGDFEEKSENEYDPYEGKQGKVYTQQIIRRKGVKFEKAKEKKDKDVYIKKKFKTLRQINTGKYLSKRDKKALRKVRKEVAKTKVSSISI